MVLLFQIGLEQPINIFLSAKKGKCTDACDESVNINLNLGDMDSYEDDEIGKRDLIEEDLHSRIKVLEKEIKTLLNNLKKVKDALRECLDRNHLDRKIYDVRVSKIVLRKCIATFKMKV